MAWRVALLLLTFVPVTEAVERALGVAEHAAHVEGLGGEDRSPSAPEHGCAALLHTCGSAPVHAALFAPDPTPRRFPGVIAPGRDERPGFHDRTPDAPPVPPPNVAL